MKQIFSATILILAFCFAGFAQNKKDNAPNRNKIFIVNSQSFRYEESGIKELSAAYKKFDDELKPLQNELNILSAKIIEINALIPVLPNERWRFQNEVYNLQKLQDVFDSKSKDMKFVLERRMNELISPIVQKIYKALIEFESEKRISIILMVRTSSQFPISSDSDVTDDFIQFYNSRNNKTLP